MLVSRSHPGCALIGKTVTWQQPSSRLLFRFPNWCPRRPDTMAEPSHSGLIDRGAAVTATLLPDQQVCCFWKLKIKNVNYILWRSERVRNGISYLSLRSTLSITCRSPGSTAEICVLCRSTQRAVPRLHGRRKACCSAVSSFQE